MYYFLVCLLLSPIAFGEELLIDDFKSGNLDGWRMKSFVGETRYQIVEQNGRPVLQARSNASASALYKEVRVDLRKTPYLNWSWRIDTVHPIVDQRVKAGDDFSARVYVVFKTGIFPWSTHALNYVWSNYPDEVSVWPNPFTAKAMMIALRSGDAEAGTWRYERVNVREDYLRIFGREMDSIVGIAIMTDADNSGGSARAWYGPISFSQ